MRPTFNNSNYNIFSPCVVVVGFIIIFLSQCVAVMGCNDPFDSVGRWRGCAVFILMITPGEKKETRRAREYIE